jgi:FkbM family methyltransferase
MKKLIRSHKIISIAVLLIILTGAYQFLFKGIGEPTSHQITLPYRHYDYLQRLSTLRREPLQESIKFLYANVEESGNNWIDKRFPDRKHPPVIIKINKAKSLSLIQHIRKWGHKRLARLHLSPKVVEISDENGLVDEASLIRRIQGLPSDIRPITDGPYSLDVKFEDEGPYTIIHILGYKIYDFKNEGNSLALKGIYRLVEDKFPFKMTMEQYDVYRRAGSQLWQLVQQRSEQTMPKEGETAMDVGAHVGYRALAMHYCVGDKGKVYAIEVEDENFGLLKKNAEANNLKNFIPIQEAVDSIGRTATLYTRNKKSMAHGLRSFESIEDPSMMGGKNSTNFVQSVVTITMDDLFKKYDIEKVDNMHVSVTGHEVEVLKGINSILPQLKKVRVSCPYSTKGIPNIETAKELLQQKGFSNFRTHGAAVIGER